MVCLAGLELLAAGYFIAEHNRKKKEEQRIEQAASWRQGALQQSSPRHRPHPPRHHCRRRRHSDSEREAPRHRDRDWAEPKKDAGHKPRREERRDEPRASHGPRASSPRQASPLPSKTHAQSHQHRQTPNRSNTHPSQPIVATQHSSSHLSPPQPHPRLHRRGSDPPPIHHQQQPNPDHIPAHQQIHNSIFPTVPAHMYRASPLSQAVVPSAVLNHSRHSPASTPTYSPYHSPSVLSPRAQYNTSFPAPASTLPSPPPPPEGVWELPAGDMAKMMHPNPAQQQQQWQQQHQRLRAGSSGSSSSAMAGMGRPHVRFADGLDVHENIADPPPPYREF